MYSHAWNLHASFTEKFKLITNLLSGVYFVMIASIIFINCNKITIPFHKNTVQESLLITVNNRVHKPFVSLTHIKTMFLSSKVFHSKMSKQKWMKHVQKCFLREHYKCYNAGGKDLFIYLFLRLIMHSSRRIAKAE